MPGMGKRVQSKPITVFLDCDSESMSGSGSSRLGQLEFQREQYTEPQIALNAIRQIIIQETEKIESEVKQFKDEICKAFDSLEHRLDSRLSDITQTIQVLRNWPERMGTCELY